MLYSLHFAYDQLIVAQDFEGTEYMSRKLIEEYMKWRLIVNVEKSNYKAIADTSQDLILEESMGIFKHCNAYKYLGVILTKDGKHDCEIQKRIREKQQFLL